MSDEARELEATYDEQVPARPVGGDAFLGFQPCGILRDHVPVMDERILLHADIDKSGLQAIFHVLDATFIDTADNALFRRTFNEELLQMTIFHNRDPGFQTLGVDDDLTLRFFPFTNHF